MGIKVVWLYHIVEIAGDGRYGVEALSHCGNSWRWELRWYGLITLWKYLEMGNKVVWPYHIVEIAGDGR